MTALTYRVATPLLAEADAEARKLGHPFLAPEHLLIAVAEHGDGVCRTFFDRHGLTADALRKSVAAVLGPASLSAAGDDPRTIAVRSVVALSHAVTSGHGRPGARGTYTPDDLLLALLADDVAPHAVVGAVLTRAGLTPAAARAEIATLTFGDAAT